MSRAIFNAISGGTVTLDAQDTVDNKVLVIPAADGTLLYDDGSGTQTFDNIALTGAVTAGAWHGSTIDVAYGGTGATTLTGLVYGNGTSPMTAATGSQVVAVIGSTPVANATSAVTSTNIAGGASGSIPYQTGSGATSLLPKGSDGQYLKLASGLPSWGDITSISTLTGNVSSPLSIQFGNGSAVSLAAGKMWYDNTTGSLNFGMGGGNITQQVGEEIFIYGKASAAITEGQLICKTGTVGASGVITFAPSPTGLTTNDGIIGVATENIASGAFGRITTFGVIHGINTTGSSVGETWADNDTLYYNPSYVGGLTKVKPSAPNIKFEVATVINAGSGGSGSIQVLLQPGSTLGGTDSNVQFGTLATNNLIQYNGTYWTNVAASSVSVGSATTATTATNIAGGASGSLPYQTASGTTALLPKGTDGQVLSLVSGLPAWISVSGAGTVTSVDGSGGTTGLTLTGGPITSSGTLTLGGTLVVANGGTGAATLTGYVKGNGTSAMTASSTIPNTDISGLGTMSTQNAGSVAITGGSINGTTIGASTASTGAFTTLSASSQLTLTNASGYNLYASGAGANYFAGAVGIGGTPNAGRTLDVKKNITGSTSAQGVVSSGTIQSDVTSQVYEYWSYATTAAAAFTLTSLQHFRAEQGAIGAGSAVTNQYGFVAESSLTGATNNFGFYGNIASGTGRYNFYAAGTAANVFAGTTSIGGTVGSESLRVTPVASAVNYVNIAGSATGSGVGMSAQGSDTNVNLSLSSKGTGFLTFFTNNYGNVQFNIANTASAVNYLQITGAATGNAATLSAQGSDTNINLKLSAKGTGYVQTAAAYSPNLTLTDAATIAWDTSTGTVATFTFVSSNRTMGAPTNLKDGAFYSLAVIQNAGSNTLTWNSIFKWAGGSAPTLSTAAGAKDYFVFRSDGTNLYEQGRSLGVA